MGKKEILQELKLFSLKNGGIGNWLTEDADEEVFKRLSKLNKDPLTKVQLDQLLAFGHEGGVSYDFFKYYWLKAPEGHPYDVTSVEFYNNSWAKQQSIISLPHLKWGLYRLFTDGLLWFGNIRTAFRTLSRLSYQELNSFFHDRRFNTQLIKERGPALPLISIRKDDRYLISEMACKSYGDNPDSSSSLKMALLESFKKQSSKGSKRFTIRQLLQADLVKNKYADQQEELIFSADDVLDEPINSERDIEKKYGAIAKKFSAARETALKNTRFYLSMVGDLDVYVATSMRSRKDFRDMADACEMIFSNGKLERLKLRYFDPTLSAAEGHEDKGLIECLMVKCTKVLVYCAGDKESYGKDAEAAMALSLGKPVIFYCNSERKNRFYRDLHPLSRLIEFETGVAVGAIVTDDLGEVSELLYRIFENKMEYELEHSKQDYLKLKEKLTGSVVRLQTNDIMLSETFWNYYDKRLGRRFI